MYKKPKIRFKTIIVLSFLSRLSDNVIVIFWCFIITFNRKTVKRITVPFEIDTYLRYLDGLVICDISLKGYSKKLLQSLKQLATMVYSSNSNNTQNSKYVPPSAKNTTFSPSMNNTLEQMSKRY